MPPDFIKLFISPQEILEGPQNFKSFLIQELESQALKKALDKTDTRRFLKQSVNQIDLNFFLENRALILFTIF